MAHSKRKIKSMANDYNEKGLSLDLIGKKHGGISRQAVSEVFKRYGIKAKKYNNANRRKLLKADKEKLAQMNTKNASKELKIPLDTLRKYSRNGEIKCLHGNIKFNLSREELIELYINQNLPASRIGRRYRVHLNTVVRKLRKYGIYKQEKWEKVLK